MERWVLRRVVLELLAARGNLVPRRLARHVLVKAHLQAEVLVERWRHEYNTFRPHSALGYRPPAPEAVEPKTALGVR